MKKIAICGGGGKTEMNRDIFGFKMSRLRAEGEQQRRPTRRPAMTCCSSPILASLCVVDEQRDDFDDDDGEAEEDERIQPDDVVLERDVDALAAVSV